ncbi:ribonuclease HII [Mycoplasmopsis canis UF31]|uniref:ribonuclease HIII n=1 Tax=Mycoplasmopsis canis TaxID=29555 RepID=UPI00025ADBFE|nr:ribonuclease HIII [Mycoplasmopsis canis]EIE41040.1 ribonuclease HII [Mycoplasmopsis canis UF31]
MFFLDHLDFDINKENILGIDETGVGDYFTPVISCAALLPIEMHQWAKQLGVKDSKLLSQSKINEIASILKTKIPHVIYTLSQSGYNKLTNKKFNANEIKFFIHNQSIINFDKKFNINSKKIIIDKYSTINSINKYKDKFSFINEFNDIYNKYNQITFIEKAETISLSVACASILARAHLNKIMEAQRNEWDFDFLLGASSKAKEQIKEFEQKFGSDSLEKVAKTSFKL